MTREEFGRRLAAARKAAGHTQATAAERLGIPQPRIAEYEAGKVVPPLPRLIEIMDALGLSWRLVLPEAFRRGRRG
jgi:transcriptional regulator with XRE-family HTH domain